MIEIAPDVDDIGTFGIADDDCTAVATYEPDGTELAGSVDCHVPVELTSAPTLAWAPVALLVRLMTTLAPG